MYRTVLECVPAFKKDSHLDVNNYRPITILIAVDKVFEHHLSMNLIAYREMYNCETSLLRSVEEWKRTLNSKDVVGVPSADMYKAFDSLHPPLLLAKLKAYGFSEHALDLLRSCFTERQNRVRIGTENGWKLPKAALNALHLVHCCGTYSRMT